MGKVVDEIWRPIKDYEGLYEISNLGNVKSLSRFQNGRKRKIEEHYIKQFDDKNGYFQITLFKNRKKHCLKVHRLVAETFIPNPNNLPCVNHKDGNKINNRVDNLEWCSYKENTNHAWKIGLCSTRKYKHYSTKIVKMNEKSEILEIYESQKIASEKNNISFRAINNCLRGKSKFAGGFKWKYFEEGVDRVGA